MIKSFFTLCIFLLNFSAWAEPIKAGTTKDWVSLSKKEGITTKIKSFKGEPVDAVYGEGVFKASKELILGMLLENDNKLKWVDRIYKSTVIEKKSDFEQVIYQAFTCPFLCDDRDFVFKATTSILENGDITLDIKSVEHPNAPETVGVRGIIPYGRWLLKDLGNGNTFVSVEVLNKPLGGIPSFIVNFIQDSWAFNTLDSLRTHFKSPFVTPFSIHK